MRIAIFSRPGPCFPNIISQGLVGMLDELGIESKIFYEGIPLLMRLLSLSKKPKRWHNNLHFRIRNKLVNYSNDRRIIKEVNEYDAIILSECYPNAFWKNYFGIEELKKAFKGPVISYTESPLDAAPINKTRHLDADDYDENIYDFNLFVTETMEIKSRINSRQAAIGINIAMDKSLQPIQKEEFVAVIDFFQPGFEEYRNIQINTLKKLGIKTIILEGRYPIEEIRKIYRKASLFFLAFPETLGLPIAECLACGTYIFTPSSAWPMAWRIDEEPKAMEPGILPDCFQVYENETELENKLKGLMANYNNAATPFQVFDDFVANYSRFYKGNKVTLQAVLNQLS